MKNVVLIDVPSVTFTAEKIQGQTIYSGVNEFVQRSAERLRERLQGTGVTCDGTRRWHKPEGFGFVSSTPSAQFYVTVCPERELLPKARLIISADQRTGFWTGLSRTRRADICEEGWLSFGPLFKDAVRSEFQDCPQRWMTIDEFIGEPAP